MLLKELEPNPELDLVEACQAGDPSAFEELVRRYKDRVYNVVYRYIGNHQDAEEVAQDVFLRAYHGLRGFRGGSRVYTWLYSIACNLAKNNVRDRGRKGRNKTTSLDALEESSPGWGSSLARSHSAPDVSLSAAESEAALQQCLDELPDHYRMPFVLRTFDNLTYEEIAEVMGCPPGTVKSRLNQARTILHRRLKERAVL
ncbi:MAG: sigma-70 family RNA polymerase sigma factor [Candidatus Hydrogenedentota bacterium]